MTPLPKTSQPAQTAVELIGIKSLEDLARYTENEISALHGVGPKAIRIWKEALKAKNLAFKTLLIFLVVVLNNIVFLQVMPVYALDCQGLDFKESFVQADVALEGEILSREGDFYTLKVITAWKQKLPSTIRVHYDSTWGDTYPLGKKLITFLNVEDGEFSQPWCSTIIYEDFSLFTDVRYSEAKEILGEGSSSVSNDDQILLIIVGLIGSLSAVGIITLSIYTKKRYW